MKLLGNLLWFVFGGLWMGLGWSLVGLLWCITIVGIPVGMQCFKLAGLAFFPFGKVIVYGGAISAALHGLLFCITIVGIPFGMQCFKFAKLALCPFGSSVAVPCAC